MPMAGFTASVTIDGALALRNQFYQTFKQHLKRHILRPHVSVHLKAKYPVSAGNS